MKYGYIRVSTGERNPDRQYIALEICGLQKITNISTRHLTWLIIRVIVLLEQRTIQDSMSRRRQCYEY